MCRKPRILEMMAAFFGTEYCDWHLDNARRPEAKRPYRNHWLVRRSAAKVFAEGLVILKRRRDSMLVVSRCMPKPSCPRR